MAMGPAAFNALQEEQQQRADFEMPLAMRRLGIAGNDALRIGGAVGSGALRVADSITGVSDLANSLNPFGTGYVNSLGQFANVTAQQGGTLANNIFRDYLNNQDDRLGLGAGNRAMAPVPTRSEILARSAAPAPALAPRPDALDGPAFAPSPIAAPVQRQQPDALSGPAFQPQAQQRTPQKATAPAPAMPPTPQERQKNLADIMATPETLEAVAKAGSVRGGKNEVIKTRRGFTPENLGMIAFGLTLMTGGDMSEALNNGLSVHGNLDQMRDEKQQRKASQELLKSVPKEYVPALNALIESKQFEKVADYAVGIEQDRQAVEREDAATEAANARRAALAQQTAAVLGVSPDAISMMPPEKLAQMVVNQFDSNNAAALAQQKAALKAQADAAIEGDQASGIEFLAAYGIDAANLPQKAIEKQVEKLSVGQFSQGESTAAGHAYVMATVIPRLEYLEETHWDKNFGFKKNRAAAAEYDQLLNELALAINRKDSGAAISIPEKKEVRDLYGFKIAVTGGSEAANAAAQRQRRSKYKAIKGQAGLALPHMMVNNPIVYDSDVLAGGVTIGVGTDFIPTPYDTNPDGVEFLGAE